MIPPLSPEAWLHASAVALGEDGLLLLGPSGSGKSHLAAVLIDEASARGRFAAVIGDDRVRIRAANGRLLAGGHPILAGTLERRGVGLLARPALGAVRLKAAVALRSEAIERLPQPDAITVLGLDLPCLHQQAGAADALGIRLWFDALGGPAAR